MTEAWVLVFALMGEPGSHVLDLPRNDCVAVMLQMDRPRTRFACCYPQRDSLKGGLCLPRGERPSVEG
jgi:hypothetical protein